MKVFLDLPSGSREQLWGHLLQNDIEQVAIVFAAVENRSGTLVFNAKDVYLASASDFEIQTGFHVELTDEARSRIIKKAWDTATTPVEFHSHPCDPWRAMFSSSDLFGFSEYVPHCRWRLRGLPYLAVLVNPGGIDALIWIDSNDKPVALESIRIAGGETILPTNKSIEYLSLEVSDYGP